MTQEKLADKMNITKRNIEKNIAVIKSYGIIKRIGPDKGGHWKVHKRVDGGEK